MKSAKRWHDLSDCQKTAVIVASMLQVALMGAALCDIHHRSADEIHGSKTMWTMAAFINFVGPIAYFAVGRKRERCA